MNRKETIIKFFPFAWFRIESLTDYINEMYRNGYRIIKIKFGCILYFQQEKMRDDLRYVILTRYFNHKARHRKWDDADFIEKRNASYHRGDGFQFKNIIVTAETAYEVYLTNAITDDDLTALREYRKKHLIKGNAEKIFFSLIDVMCLILLIIWLIKLCGL